MKKKFLAFLLAALMVVSLLPVTAFADNCSINVRTDEGVFSVGDAEKGVLHAAIYLYNAIIEAADIIYSATQSVDSLESIEIQNDNTLKIVGNNNIFYIIEPKAKDGYKFDHWELGEKGGHFNKVDVGTIDFSGFSENIDTEFMACFVEDNGSSINWKKLAKGVAITAGITVVTVGTIHTVKAIKNYKAEKAAAAEAAKLAEMPMVRMGDSGDAVMTLQTELNAQGYNCGEVDGVFGQNTLNAVIAFQTAKGLTADGVVGKLTWTELL